MRVTKVYRFSLGKSQLSILTVCPCRPSAPLQPTQTQWVSGEPDGGPSKMPEGYRTTAGGNRELRSFHGSAAVSLPKRMKAPRSEQLSSLESHSPSFLSRWHPVSYSSANQIAEHHTSNSATLPPLTVTL